MRQCPNCQGSWHFGDTMRMRALAGDLWARARRCRSECWRSWWAVRTADQPTDGFRRPGGRGDHSRFTAWKGKRQVTSLRNHGLLNEKIWVFSSPSQQRVAVSPTLLFLGPGGELSSLRVGIPGSWGGKQDRASPPRPHRAPQLHLLSEPLVTWLRV